MLILEDKGNLIFWELRGCANYNHTIRNDVCRNLLKWDKDLFQDPFLSALYHSVTSFCQKEEGYRHICGRKSQSLRDTSDDFLQHAVSKIFVLNKILHVFTTICRCIRKSPFLLWGLQSWNRRRKKLKKFYREETRTGILMYKKNLPS